MAITLASDLKVYEPEIQAGIYEGVAQFINGVVAASAGAIVLGSEQMPGHYNKQAFLDLVMTTGRRDITSAATLTPAAATQDEFVQVKLSRGTNAIAISLDSLKKAGLSQEQIFLQLGRQYAEVKMQDMLNTGLIAVEAAIEGGSTATNYDATGASPLTIVSTDLVEGLAKFGDRAGDVVAWVSHSKPYFDLVKAQVGDKIYGNANLVVYGGTPATFGRPFIVTDAAALTDANGSATDTYNVLGLTRGALSIVESEEETLAISDIQVANVNMHRVMKGEYAFTVGVRGMRYDITSGGANPTDAALGTTTNWDRAVASIKHTAGVRIKVN
jgi:hypothetical protein